jgi:competence protein ComEA
MGEIVVGGTWRERLEALAGKRRDAWIVALVVTAVVLGALVLWRRGNEARVAPPAIVHTEATAGATPSAAPLGGPGSLLVHVAGAVRRPGLYELPAGARVADAIDAARGPQRRAELDALTLAEALVDGQKVEALESIPGIGPVTAAAILELRAQIGSFTSIEQLIDVSGIGPATLESIRPYVTV